jgi:hypothetical protein
LEAIVSLQQQTERSVLHSVLTETGGHPPFWPSEISVRFRDPQISLWRDIGQINHHHYRHYYFYYYYYFSHLSQAFSPLDQAWSPPSGIKFQTAVIFVLYVMFQV